MSLVITYCLSGCTVRGQHLADCDDREGCRGCLPRPAEFGQLCAWCWQRLNADVVDAPALARYLWAVAHAGPTSGPSDDRVASGGDPAERGVVHAAIDALDGLHACLASWAHLILEEHPDGEHMAGPDERGVRVTQWSPARVLACDELAEPYYVKPTVAGVRDTQATSRLVRWLLPHLAWCSAQEWAGEMRREVADVVRTTAARYPVAERTRDIPGVACPVCERVSLVLDPPTTERHTTQVTCSTRGCGVIYSEDDFRRLTKIVEWEQGERRMA